MTDTKQKVKEEFAAIVKTDMDALFDRELTPEEIDTAVVGEVGKIIGEVTAMNNLDSYILDTNIKVITGLKSVQGEVKDLEKILKLKEDLDMAA